MAMADCSASVIYSLVAVSLCRFVDVHIPDVDRNGQECDEQQPGRRQTLSVLLAVAGQIDGPDVDTLLRQHQSSSERESRHWPSCRHEIIRHSRAADCLRPPPVEGADVGHVLQVEVEGAHQLVEAHAHAKAARLQVDQKLHDLTKDKGVEKEEREKKKNKER